MIREFFYVDSQGQQVGPVLFEDLKKLPVTSTTLVWFPGQADWKKVQDVPEFIEALFGSFTPPPVPPQAKPDFVPDNNVCATPGGDDTHLMFDNEETKIVYPRQNESVNVGSRPAMANVHNTGATAGNGLTLKTLLLIIFGAAIVLTGFLWLMVPRTACAFNAKPLTTAIVFGGLILIGAVFAAVYNKAKSAKIALIVAGVLIGGGQVLISYGRFDDKGRYKDDFLINYKGVFDKWGDEILSGDRTIYRIDGEKGARFMKCYIDGYGENMKIEISAYDEEGDRVIHESLDVPYGYTDHNKRNELQKMLVEYLEEEYKIVIDGNFELH